MSRSTRSIPHSPLASLRLSRKSMTFLHRMKTTAQKAKARGRVVVRARCSGCRRAHCSGGEGAPNVHGSVTMGAVHRAAWNLESRHAHGSAHGAAHGPCGYGCRDEGCFRKTVHAG